MNWEAVVTLLGSFGIGTAALTWLAKRLLSQFLDKDIERYKATLERETAASNDLYRQRVEALNAVWRAFLPVKGIYAEKITLGHENWVKPRKSQALTALNDFRGRIDENQVILPEEVVRILREIDTYLFEVLDTDDQAPSIYVCRLNSHLATLSDVVNEAFAKRTHSIELKLRT